MAKLAAAYAEGNFCNVCHYANKRRNACKSLGDLTRLSFNNRPRILSDKCSTRRQRNMNINKTLDSGQIGLRSALIQTLV